YPTIGGIFAMSVFLGSVQIYSSYGGFFIFILISFHIDVYRFDAYNIHIEVYECEEPIWKTIRIIQRCLKRWEKPKEQ
ncbi:hypothetical protein, partial [Faecalispora jeddahensis]|uniref:hypothetical protein n=1 Tax=Faecalispora jeddahensis TaxID=1414721 RepID=UPI0028AC3563